MKNLDKQVYILSLEASDIYEHMMVRDNEIKYEYPGMIPFSLELIKLRKVGIDIKSRKNENDKTNDIINVKFKQKVKSGEYITEKLNEKINNLLDYENDEFELSEKDIKYINNLELKSAIIKLEIDSPKWEEVSPDKLRKHLYKNGFILTDENGKQTKYVVYKRSSSKSRTGQCLFIKEELYDEMINWSRMYLPFKEGMDIDYASLLAYESLVLSSLEDTITIKSENILIVDDLESKFTKTCNVIRAGKDGFLDSFTEPAEITNSLFDGESLLDSEYFAPGQSMKLLRNHMFKSAAFNTNIQKFLIDSCPKTIKFDEWKIQNMFGQEILAKDIKLIITPSSLKALKFSHVFDCEKDMWIYWKQIVDLDKGEFGVCKHEKQSKRGVDTEGNVLQQTSYQMLNCVPMNDGDIKELVKFEDEYIDKLKNDNDFFIEHISKGVNTMNSNMMFVDLYKRNKMIVHTKLFRDFRKSEVNKYVTNVKKGKVRLSKGDYCVMLGNPIEFLYHAIGKSTYSLALKGNEVYTTLFDFGKELVGFRNPNTSPSNVLVAKNTYIEEIEKYFNLTDNIVCVNAVKFELQDLLSGCDYDSDTLVLFDNPKLLELGKQCFGKYPVCINKVEGQKKKYKLTKSDMCVIDNQLANSQRNIGKVVNLGQLCMSTYWDKVFKWETEGLDILMKKVDVMSVLSGISIDMAKRFYNIDIEKEIKHVNNIKELYKKKPQFFRYISQGKNIDEKVQDYNCPMDYLFKVMSDLGYGEHHENEEFVNLLIKGNIKKGDRKQEKKILSYVDEMIKKVSYYNAKYANERKEKNTLIQNTLNHYEHLIGRLSVKPDTMYSILIHMMKKKGKAVTNLLNVLYKTQKDVFLQSFKEE